MDQKASTKSASKRQLTKVQAITVMAVGGLMILLSIVIPTEQNSTAHTVKVIFWFLGVCVLVVGGYFRPMEATKDSKV